MAKYINADELKIDLLNFEAKDYFVAETKQGIRLTINALDSMPSVDVVEVESLKTYITNLISNIPQTDYVKDDYDAGFADALRIIYTHLCGERKETE